MKGDGFGTDEVVAARNGSGDDGGPAAVVCDHLASGPHTLSNRTAQQACFFDLELIIEGVRLKLINRFDGKLNLPIERSGH